MFIYKEEIRIQTHTEGRPWENREEMAIGEGERLKEEPALPTRCFRLLDFQNSQKISIWWLSHPVWGTLLWQP